MYKLTLAVFFLTLFGATHFLKAQGCSDAGFCTMGAMKPDQPYQKKLGLKLRSLTLTQYTGYTDHDDYIHSYIADFNFGINEKTSLQLKLPYTFTTGPLGSLNGLGDISISATRNLFSSEKLQWNATVGGKIPTGKANGKTDAGRTLPMYYQTTLGTYDVVVGTSLITEKWLIATGYQVPLNTNNAHDFKWGVWNDTDLIETVRGYKTSNQLRRGHDIMLRVERNFRFLNFNANIGILNVYRPNKDIISVPKDGGRRGEVDGTQGFATTLLGGLGYRLTARSGLSFMGGYRLRKRAAQADGLSRIWVANFSYEYKF